MSPIRNIAAAFVSFLGASLWTKGLSYLVKTRRLRPRAARKVMHISTAPLFALTWPLYGTHRRAAYFAAAVPLSFALRILSNPQRDTLVRAVAYESNSPSTDQGKEPSLAETESPSTVHLRHAYGPISYGLSVAAVTALSWRNQPETYISLAALCFGDGMADVVGSACNGPRWPLPPNLFTKRKTIPGTIAFFVSALLGSIGSLKLARLFRFTPHASWGAVFISAGSSALIELLPVEDNLTVPALAFFAARFCQEV